MAFKFLTEFFGVKSATEPEKEEVPAATPESPTDSPAEEEQEDTPSEKETAQAARISELEISVSDAQTLAADFKTKYEAAEVELKKFGATAEDRTKFLAESKQLYAWYENSQKLGVLGAAADANETEPQKRESSVTKEAKALEQKRKKTKS